LQLKLPYDTTFLLSVGTFTFLMKQIVLVGFSILPFAYPFANLPNSLADDLDHTSLYFGCCMSSVLEVCVRFFIVDRLCSFRGSCGSSEVRIICGDACHCF